MTDVVPLHDPEAVVAGVAAKVGGLTNEEYALVYGAAVARRATDPDGAVAVATLHSAAQVLMILRRQRCAWRWASTPSIWRRKDAGSRAGGTNEH